MDEKLKKQAAAYCYATTVLNTTSGQYYIEPDDIASFLCVDVEELDMEEISEELTHSYDGVNEASVEEDDSVLSVVLFTDYMANNEN